MSVAPLLERSVKSATFLVLSDLFRYPDASFADRLDRARNVLPGDEALEAFAQEIRRKGREHLEAIYTSTFDLAPSCTPYLGAHLFGDEGRERGRMLIGLRMSYQAAGLVVDERELPDHLTAVLAFAAHDQAEEWSDLVRLILLPALTKMEEILRPSSNPYRHLIRAARQRCQAATLPGGTS